MLVYKRVAIEHGPVETVSFPIKHGGSFHSSSIVYQRVAPGISPVDDHGLLNIIYR